VGFRDNRDIYTGETGKLVIVEMLYGGEEGWLMLVCFMTEMPKRLLQVDFNLIEYLD